MVDNMKGEFLNKKTSVNDRRTNVFAKQSGLLLHHLLMRADKEFRLREIAREVGLSHGLVQRVISELLHVGIVESEGVRTAKRYTLRKPKLLLQNWLENYSIMDKCRFYNYSSGYSVAEIEEKLRRRKESEDFVLALHTAARALKCVFTNLATVELYCKSEAAHEELRDILRLESIDRGYDVLVIEPYYQSIVAEESSLLDELLVSSPLLTLLELYHFPLRGKEQAEHLIRSHEQLKPLVGAV